MTLFNADTAGAAVLFVVTAAISLLGLWIMPAIIRLAALRPYWLIRKAEYWRLISAGFVHANLSHLLLNLLTYYFFAFALERRIGLLSEGLVGDLLGDDLRLRVRKHARLG